MSIFNHPGRATRLIRLAALAGAVSLSPGILRAETPASQPAERIAIPSTGPSAADSPVAAPPTTGPAVASGDAANNEIADLIRKLGDTDYHVRTDAARRLKAIGRDALPALKAAQNSDDPEVQVRVHELLAAIEHPPTPVSPTIVARPHSIRISVVNGARTIDAIEEGRTTHIQDGAGGIKMSVTDQVNGKARTREFAAVDADDLKKQSPEAFALYNLWANQQAMIINGPGNMARLQVQAQVFPVPVPNPAVLNQLRAAHALPAPGGGDDLKALRERLDRQMLEKSVSEENRKQVLDRIDEMLKISRQQADAQGQNLQEQTKKYLQQSDELRKAIADLKLPDPGPMLPPPTGARLGISVGTAGPENNGIRVIEVIPESRAAKVGLMADDVIQKINGQEIQTPDELRRAVSDHPTNLVIDGLRAGKAIQLKE